MLRRIFFQLGILAGCLAFVLTLWRELGQNNSAILPACLRAIFAGIAIMVFSLLVYGLLEKISGTDR